MDTRRVLHAAGRQPIRALRCSGNTKGGLTMRRTVPLVLAVAAALAAGCGSTVQGTGATVGQAQPGLSAPGTASGDSGLSVPSAAAAAGSGVTARGGTVGTSSGTTSGTVTG